jgi:hypothetical protein
MFDSLLPEETRAPAGLTVMNGWIQPFTHG